MITIETLYKYFLDCKSVAIDTRKIEKNSMFIAIKGDRFDANTFASEALSLGASYVVIDDVKFFIDERTILVENGLSTLQQLAAYHRMQLKCPIIALTGSNGKTTSKELINAVLSKKYNVKATIGNLNNHIGVPLTLLSFDKTTEIGIVEMGANHQKEIEFLCEIAQPDFGYITNFGKAHLEGFGGFDGVIKGKSEMYNYLITNKKTVFVNADDAMQVQKTASLSQISFSLHNSNASVFISNSAAKPFVALDFDRQTIQSQLIGLYNVSNICIAITIGNYFKVQTMQIKKAIESYVPENNRSQLITKNSNKIILDAYNANPSSMLVAINNFLQLEAENKVLILGDMFELGAESAVEHQFIVDYLAKQNFESCTFVGQAFFDCAKSTVSKSISFYAYFDDFANSLADNPFQNSTILIKGSRGIALERTLNFL